MTMSTAGEVERALRARAAILRSPCTVCGATPGQMCRTPKGSSVQIPHATRREAAMAAGNWSPS